MKKFECSTCNKDIEAKRYGRFRTCWKCHKKDNRKRAGKYRKLPEKEKIKARIRAKSRYLIKVGLLIKKPCEMCSKIESMIYHLSFNSPFDVLFLCSSCIIRKEKKKCYQSTAIQSKK